ncbi:hypothetical protein [Micromonospora avicenniae]|uniref:hypothetical protein n=1 Tax=Micromonospora avicenniae TaxID=1198245 RepID=UPI00342F195D
MEKTVLYQFLVEVPQAAAIWSALLVLALIVLTVLVARPDRDRPEDDRSAPAGPTDRESAAAEAADLRRYADEVAVAAAGATQTARRKRDEWLAAQADLDRAWAAYDEAESAARRYCGAGALSPPRTARTPAEYAARERHLHRVATAAYWRGDLTLRQLGDVFGHRDGWDPRLHPVEQEVHLARVVRDGRLAGYRAAQERERSAWRASELAAEAARALTTEAYAAAARLRPGRLPAARPASAAPAQVVTRWQPARVG